MNEFADWPFWVMSFLLLIASGGMIWFAVAGDTEGDMTDEEPTLNTRGRE